MALLAALLPWCGWTLLPAIARPSCRPLSLTCLTFSSLTAASLDKCCRCCHCQPELDGEEEEEEEEDEDREEELAWEMDETTIVRAEGEDAGLEEGLEGPAVSEEPQVRGSRRALHMHQEPAGPGANPLRRSITQERGGSAAPKSRASTGPYSLYSNKAFQQEVQRAPVSPVTTGLLVICCGRSVLCSGSRLSMCAVLNVSIPAQEQSSSETTDPLAGGSLSHARASQVLRSMSDIVSANKLQVMEMCACVLCLSPGPPDLLQGALTVSTRLFPQGPAPETMPSGQAFMHPTTAPELDSDGGSALVRWHAPPTALACLQGAFS